MSKQMEARQSPKHEQRHAQGSAGAARTIDEPKPPFPEQHQRGPGLESRLDPRPRYHAEA